MSRKVTKKEAVILLNYITVSAVLLDVSHSLKNTSIYKHELKLRIKQVETLLRQEKDSILTLFGVSETEFDALIENATELCKPLSEGTIPEDWQILNHTKNILLEDNKEAVNEIRNVIIKYKKDLL